jgi:hypothetical protein
MSKTLWVGSSLKAYDAGAAYRTRSRPLTVVRLGLLPLAFHSQHLFMVECAHVLSLVLRLNFKIFKYLKMARSWLLDEESYYVCDLLS